MASAKETNMNAAAAKKDDTIDAALKRIAAMATKVQADSKAYQDAIDAEREAEATVLEAAIEIIKPAILALSSRIIHPNQNVVLRGLPLGDGIYLTAGGGLLKVQADGTSELVTTRDLIEDRYLEDLLRAMDSALQKQSGLPGHTATATKRAERLRAILTMVRK